MEDLFFMYFVCLELFVTFAPRRDEDSRTQQAELIQAELINKLLCDLGGRIWLE
jgi:hypothetical protein